MTETVSVKAFITFINQAFPGGALFALLSDGEFKKLLMQLSSKLLAQEQECKYAARIVGENQANDKTYWVLSEDIQVEVMQFKIVRS